MKNFEEIRTRIRETMIAGIDEPEDLSKSAEDALSEAVHNRADNWLNLSAIARYFNVPRSTFLQRVNDYGWESALAYYEQLRKSKQKH